MRQKSNRISDPAILPAPHLQTTLYLILKQQLSQKEGELLPAFHSYYEKLRALPRRMRRALQRYSKRSLAGIALLLALGQAPALAATINVGGTCTLVRAINSANNDTAAGGCAAGGGEDTIILPAGRTTVLTAVNNTNYGRTGLPVIRSAVTIDGNGSTIRRQRDASPFRLFAVGESGNLTLRETTLSGGIASGAYPSDQGSALYNLGNAALVNSTISGNVADDDAATVENYEGNLSVINSTISGNEGYGVNSFLGNAVITGSTVSDNSSIGVVATFGNLSVINSTLSGNEKGVSGANTSITLINSTVTGSSSDGIEALYFTDVVMLRNIISGNAIAQAEEVRPDEVSVRRAREAYFDVSSFFDSSFFNVLGQNGNANVGGFRPGATDIVPAGSTSSIIDTQLADNGGPTLTHALVRGCPAIDAVTDGACPPPGRDQRGMARPQDGNGDGGPACDIGSFEMGPPIAQ
jgi:hypothetical protein